MTTPTDQFLDATRRFAAQAASFAAYSLRDMPRAAWLHVIYIDMHGQAHSEDWACSFTEAEQRLTDIGAIHWEIGI